MKTTAYILLLVLVGSLSLLAGWYQIDGQPEPGVERLLVSERFSFHPRADGGYSLQPSEPNGRAVLIMHGALVQPLAYADTAAFFAGRGFLVEVPYGGWSRLSIQAIQSARDTVRSQPGLQWFFIGHSMGGFASLKAIVGGHLPVAAVGLWAAAMPENFSGTALPVLFLGGDRDGLLHADRLASMRHNYPAGSRFRLLSGANHRNFARYTHQFFDGEASLSVDEQIQQANTLTLAFFREVAGPLPAPAR